MDVLYHGATVAEDVPIVDGSVTVDRGSATRRSLSLTIPDPADLPGVETDPYAPYGQVLAVWRGVRYLDGRTELVPVGRFRVESVSGDVHTGPLTISAPGIESEMQAEPIAGHTATAGSAAAWIQGRLHYVRPDADLINRATDATWGLPRTTYAAGDDRWQAMTDVATASGAELYADALGAYVLADVPDPENPGPPVWTVGAGDGGVMTSAVVDYSADGLVNRVRVHGENTAEGTPPVVARATLTDVSNPLRWGGPFGRRTLHTTSQLATNTGRAQNLARTLLRQHSTRHHTVTVSSVPNPALDAGDCIRVEFGPQRPPELHIVHSFTLPLGDNGGTFTINTMSGRSANA
ncbi:DUF5047 domain-containing protein [Streptomyces sp. SM12]|uniref:DUF5047 domain-containing protein n=1 Tax=Streptomyces sp. SM12 TaxID=1071602 RepID=UPI0015E19118|nr:DUF5047 domain-containing protein [Streptomyces sp. SM12]